MSYITYDDLKSIITSDYKFEFYNYDCSFIGTLEWSMEDGYSSDCDWQELLRQVKREPIRKIIDANSSRVVAHYKIYLW